LEGIGPARYGRPGDQYPAAALCEGSGASDPQGGFPVAVEDDRVVRRRVVLVANPRPQDPVRRAGIEPCVPDQIEGAGDYSEIMDASGMNEALGPLLETQGSGGG